MSKMLLGMTCNNALINADDCNKYGFRNQTSKEYIEQDAYRIYEEARTNMKTYAREHANFHMKECSYEFGEAAFSFCNLYKTEERINNRVNFNVGAVTIVITRNLIEGE